MNSSKNPQRELALPRRPLTPTIIPIAVVVSTLALLVWSVWPVLHPSRVVQISQAVFVQGDEPPSPDTDTRTPQPRSTRVVQAAGWLEAEPFFTAATALADGVVQEMLVLEGDRVESGQPIARLIDIDARLELARTQAELDRAKAELREAEAVHTAATRNWNEPIELERSVASTLALLREREAELAQLPSLIRAERAMLTRAEEERKSIEQAYRGDAATHIEYINAREHANMQVARVESIEAREPVLRAAIEQIESDLHASRRALELRIEDRARLESAAAMLESARAEVALRRAGRDEAQLRFDRMVIRAPIAGFVQRRHKVPGDKVIRNMDDPHSNHIVHIYDPERLQVRVDVPLADASQVFVGQACEVVVEVLPDRVFTGCVLRVTHQADLQKNTLQVKVKVHDPDPVLRPEMLTRVKFLPDDSNGAAITDSTIETTTIVQVPRDAIESLGESHRVWTVTQRANGRGVLRPVQVNPIDLSSGWATVSGDLHPGTVIVADPEGCVPGERVRLSPTKGEPS